MRRTALAAALALVCGRATAMDASGHTALALGALVGIPSPALSSDQRTRLADMLDGKKGNAPAIVVAGDASCRAGDVDIAAFSCELAYGKQTASLTGRAAHELFATLAEAGVPSDGAAGSVYEAVHGLSCKIEPSMVAEDNGGGANCLFEAGPPPPAPQQPQQ